MTRNGDTMKTYTLSEAEIAAIIQQAFDTILPARDQAIADAVAETVAKALRAEYEPAIDALTEAAKMMGEAARLVAARR